MASRLSAVWSLVMVCWSLSAVAQKPLNIIKQWNLANYNFDYDEPTNAKNYFVPENIVATGIAMSHDRVFIATPRLFSGVPATLSWVPLNEYGESPLFRPYPDWSFHAAGKGTYNCSDLGIVSVYRLRIDSCNRLWVLDAGVSRSLEDFEVTCPPKILIFDLVTNEVVRRIDFPRQVRRGESLFTNIIIDETTSKLENGCDDVFTYISDTVEPAIVVYDSGRDLTWRLTHPAMYPDPDFAQSDILGDQFVLMDGIVGIAFDAKAGLVYFQPLATDRVFSISTQVLRAGPVPVTQILPVKLVGKKSSQGVSLAVSPADGTIIFSPLTETALATYNPQTNQQRTLSFDAQALQFVADMTLSNYDTGALYVLSSRFQRYFLKNIDANDVNIRIIRVQLLDPATTDYFRYSQKGRFTTVPIPQLNPPNVFPKPSYNSRYFNRVQQPFQFESVGTANKGVTNPFTGLNSGEQIPQRTSAYPNGNAPFGRINLDFGNFNSLRVAKSIMNATIIHT